MKQCLKTVQVKFALREKPLTMRAGALHRVAIAIAFKARRQAFGRSGLL